MVSTLKAKQTGVWSGAVADGAVKVKSGGVWKSPAYIYAKRDAAWVDSGYRGFPLTPQSIAVHAWDFANVNVSFTGPPAGGAPTASYEVQQTNSAGTQIGALKSVTGSPSGNFAVGEDGQYMFNVRSKSAAGLVSPWRGPLKVKIGHTETGYYANENRTRGWSSEHLYGHRNKDDPFWVGFWGNVVIQGMHWRNLWTQQSGVISPGTNRTVNIITYGADQGALNNHLGGTIYRGHNYDWGFGNAGDGSPWGIVARGTGWSTTGNTYYTLYLDDFWCDGYEIYQVSVYYVTRSYAGNSYW